MAPNPPWADPMNLREFLPNFFSKSRQPEAANVVSPDVVPAEAVSPEPAAVDAVPATHLPIATEDYKAELLRQIETTYGLQDEPLNLIRSGIAQLPTPGDRLHAADHEVRYLLTYAMMPAGPGFLVDVGASEIYSAPLREIKKWRMGSVPVLSINFERDPLPFESESVDGVLLCEVIEHFTLDPLHCLNEINRILKPGGVVLVTTPNICSWFAIYQALNQRHPSRWPVYSKDETKAENHLHAREYTVPELLTVLDAAGFTPIEITTRDYGISPPYRPIPGYDAENRGETIFCTARKDGKPRKRAVSPLYLEDRPFS